MKLFLARFSKDEHQVKGVMFGIKKNKVLFRCVTAEMPWKFNEENSCIPSGSYQVIKAINSEHNLHLTLLNVGIRKEIKIHAGVFNPLKLNGCILVGNDFTDSTLIGVSNTSRSQQTLDRLTGLMPGESEIVIMEAEKMVELEDFFNGH